MKKKVGAYAIEVGHYSKRTGKLKVLRRAVAIKNTILKTNLALGKKKVIIKMIPFEWLLTVVTKTKVTTVNIDRMGPINIIQTNLTIIKTGDEERNELEKSKKKNKKPCSLEHVNFKETLLKEVWI